MRSLPLPGEDNPILRVIQASSPFLNMEIGPWVAGGAARRLASGETDISVSDIDVFFPNSQMFEWGLGFFRQQKNRPFTPFSIENESETPAGHTFQVVKAGENYRFQLLKKRFFKNLDELFNDFDFTVCMFATDGETLLAEDRAPADLSARKLVLHNSPPKPKAARFAKYCSQGFTPEPGVIRAMFGVDTTRFFPDSDLTCDEY